jgi:hypothetical protein
MEHKITVVTTTEDGTQITTEIDLEAMDSWLIAETMDQHRQKIKDYGHPSHP